MALYKSEISNANLKIEINMIPVSWDGVYPNSIQLTISIAMDDSVIREIKT